MKSYKLLVFACSVIVALGKNGKYKGYKMLQVTPTNHEQLESLLYIEGSVKYTDFWMHPTINISGLIVVPRKSFDNFTTLIKTAGIKYDVQIDDVEKKLNEEDAELEESKGERTFMKTTGNRDIGYSRYYRYEEIDRYMDYLAETYPDKVRLYHIGKSYEGRNLKYVHVSGSGFRDPHKNIIYVDACHHAREWISIPVVTYVLRKLLQDVTENDVNMDVDWVVMPLVNPDGYEYTHTDDRMWRKTRSINTKNPHEQCKGVDPNRNYGYKWMHSGSSADPCDVAVYAGPKPFSESETRAVRDILHTYIGRIKLYVTVHSAASMILYPWGHDGSFPPNANQLHKVGQLAADAIDKASPFHAEKYEVGNSARILHYVASGGADDYAKSIGVPLTYTLELPRERRGFRFVVSPNQIQQIVNETWQGFIVFAREVKKIFG